MSTPGLARLLDRWAGQPEGELDSRLLARFVGRRDGDAFAALVRRYGALVHGTCRRILGDRHEADDAFQAVFFVLARRAGTLRPDRGIGPWLHGVALRVAKKLRGQLLRRRLREMAAAKSERVEAVEPDFDFWAVIDEELARLPLPLREVVLLCDLGGQPYARAARALGIAKSTVATRLTEAHEQLAVRLKRRGLALGVGAVSTTMASRAPASVGGPLVRETVRQAIAFSSGPMGGSATIRSLAEGVMRSAKIRVLKMWLAVSLSALTLAGGGLTLGGDPGDRNDKPPAAKADAKPDTPAAPPANDRVAETPQGRVEFVGLKSMTAKEALERAAGKAVDGKLKMCAPCIKEAGFGETAVAVYPGKDGKLTFVVAVVEKADAGRIKYRAAPPAADAPLFLEWKAGLTAAADPGLFQAVLLTYGHFLDGKPEKADGVFKALGQDAAKVKGVWEFLKSRDKPAERDRAVWALANHGDPAHRAVAAAVLMNFPDSDLTWWALADAQREPGGLVAQAAGQALRVLVKHRPRSVEWGPAVPTLRYLLGGTSLFEYLPTLDMLVATRADRGLAADLANDSVLLRAYLRAEHPDSRAHAVEFVRHASGKDLADAAACLAWLDGRATRSTDEGK